MINASWIIGIKEKVGSKEFTATPIGFNLLVYLSAWTNKEFIV
jgi:hypothetical protein